MALSRVLLAWLAVTIWLLAWGLKSGLVGALREWPRRSAEGTDVLSIGLSALRVTRTVAAGGILAWRLGDA